MFMAFGLHLLLKSWVAIEASRRLSEDRQSGALELLLVTPLKPHSIVEAQRKAIWNVFALPVFLLTLVNLAMIWLILGPDPVGMGTDERPIFIGIYLGGIGLLLLDVHALTRTAMWNSLTARRHNRAILAALGRVMLPSWAAILFLVFLGMARVGINQNEMKTFVVFWFLLGVVVDLAAIAWAETKLRLEFRQTAALGQANSSLEVREVSPAPWKLSHA
jgi:ABC-type Na+ efflux pump permease subunit